ncbi:MAG: response regulator transcription factor [Bacteroidota bacterium]
MASILIVEDDPIIAADLQDRLGEMGHTVEEVCYRGEQAIASYAAAACDLVLMDIQLEGKLDGVETALALRTQGAERIIFLTSNSDDANFKRAKAAAPRAFLSKPFRGRDLRHAIELALADVRPSPASPNTAEEEGTIVEDRIFVKARGRHLRVFLDDILWIEADDYYAKVITVEREYLVTKTLKKVENQLPVSSFFFRINRSAIVNLKRITEVGETNLFFGEKRLGVNRSSRAKVVARLNNL